jgi:DNA (cytosine-5)-methyltransferase 1
VRRVRNGRRGGAKEEAVSARKSTKSICAICDPDAAFLRGPRPPYEALRPRLRVVDLFAGCGGLTLGAAEAARHLGLGLDVRLAIDEDETAKMVYAANFPDSAARCEKVESLFDGGPGEDLTAAETEVKEDVGQVDVLVGGPPCQGHSDLNNHTRRGDPRNALYARMARAAEVLEPCLVLIENVPTVTHDVERVVEATVERLRASDYTVAEAVIDISRLGAPQKRRRHVVLATRDAQVEVEAILEEIEARCPDHPARSVRWAIGDLASKKADTMFDSASVPSTKNARRIAWLFEEGEYDLPNRRRPKCHRSKHSYTSMYGRLKWKEPAQTVTTGFGSMGQGRYVHPSKPRTITPHEAARLQTLPDFFDFSGVTKRGALARLIGNAVPPVLAAVVLEPALRSLGLAPSVAFPVTRNGQMRTRATRMRRRPSRAGATRRAGVPEPSSAAARKRMISVRRSETAAERALRAEIDGLELTYRADEAVPGTRNRADLLFEESGVAVMVDGCFWHGCPKHGTSAKANAEWWEDKLAGNRRRDAAADHRLHELGWLVLRFWEHDDPKVAAESVAAAVAGRNGGAHGAPRTREVRLPSR